MSEPNKPDNPNKTNTENSMNNIDMNIATTIELHIITNMFLS